jgi:hypothetical protein
VLKGIYAGMALAAACEAAGYSSSKKSYRWLFSAPIREVVRDQTIKGQQLPPNALAAFNRLNAGLSAAQVAEVKAILRNAYTLILETLAR